MKLDGRPVGEYLDEQVGEMHRLKDLRNKIRTQLSDINAALTDNSKEAAKFVQRTVGATPDGVIGRKTMAAVQAFIDKRQRSEQQLLVRIAEIEKEISKIETFSAMNVKVDTPMSASSNGVGSGAQKFFESFDEELDEATGELAGLGYVNLGRGGVEVAVNKKNTDYQKSFNHEPDIQQKVPRANLFFKGPVKTSVYGWKLFLNWQSRLRHQERRRR